MHPNLNAYPCPNLRHHVALPTLQPTVNQAKANRRLKAAAEEELERMHREEEFVAQGMDKEINKLGLFLDSETGLTYVRGVAKLVLQHIKRLAKVRSAQLPAVGVPGTAGGLFMAKSTSVSVSAGKGTVDHFPAGPGGPSAPSSPGGPSGPLVPPGSPLSARRVASAAAAAPGTPLAVAAATGGELTFEDLAEAVVAAESAAYLQAVSRPQTSCDGYDGSERIATPLALPHIPPQVSERANNGCMVPILVVTSRVGFSNPPFLSAHFTFFIAVPTQLSAPQTLPCSPSLILLPTYPPTDGRRT